MMKARIPCAVLMLAASAAMAQQPEGAQSVEGAEPSEQAELADRADRAEQPDRAEQAERPDRVEGAGAVVGGVKALSGMSILGNQEAPKSLVIVPWKSSEIGPGIGASRALDASKRPVDKEVFMRELRYYQLRSGGSE